MNNLNEVSVIGSMIIDTNCIHDVMELVKADDFRTSINRDIFSAVCEKYANGDVIDTTTVFDAIRAKYGDDTAEKYIIECCELTPSSAPVLEYAKNVRNDSRMSKLREYGADLQTEAMGVSAEWQSVAVGCINKLQDLINNDTHTEIIRGDRWLADFKESESEIIENPDGAFCKTGYSDVDTLLGGGMFRSGMYIIGARPGMGKTTFALNIAENVVKAGKPVMFVSMEMSSHQIMCKRIAMDTGIQYTSLMNGKLSDYEQKVAFDKADELSRLPFFVTDRSGLTTNDISVMAQRVRGCELIIVDYLGLVKAKNNLRSRYEEYTDISAELKLIAKKMRIPVLVLAQLNRENTKSTDKKPQLSNLRDTGAIEQDADCVMFVHREDYYNRKEGTCNPTMEKMEIIVAKNRHGNTGTIEMSFSGEYGMINQLSNREEEYI